MVNKDEYIGCMRFLAVLQVGAFPFLSQGHLTPMPLASFTSWSAFYKCVRLSRLLAFECTLNHCTFILRLPGFEII